MCLVPLRTSFSLLPSNAWTLHRLSAKTPVELVGANDEDCSCGSNILLHTWTRAYALSLTTKLNLSAVDLG
ncbi:hypothetical protein VFPPC_15854 [Pochonia chlamydosporia 170]|uniref:Uncharacterized protein n=1 Tax=Pochonia chlamydosporia 170 TaxID=1380566 RepID=A0A179FSN6_METCM|nr:hypothetical protein VFPPC_15854 [Pochonia chlamydosporia 170]OAQ68635.1 hypothetical protein VFPPC_15854 [Pochonia chlamydosporia 170]